MKTVSERSRRRQPPVSTPQRIQSRASTKTRPERSSKALCFRRAKDLNQSQDLDQCQDLSQSQDLGQSQDLSPNQDLDLSQSQGLDLSSNQDLDLDQDRASMSKEPPAADTISLDSSNEDGPVEPFPRPDVVSDPRSSPGPCSGTDVVDLTSPVSDSSAVVDLTNDTVLVLDEGQSYVVSSDEEDLSVTVTSFAGPAQRQRSSAGVHINCPVCMDSYFEIVDSGRLLVSTRCGHVFCSICLRDSLNQSKCCPICRKKLPKGHYHPIHI